MFTVCLDKAHPHLPDIQASFRDSHAGVVAKKCLHGNGTQQNSCNRWFDTAVQVRELAGGRSQNWAWIPGCTGIAIALYDVMASPTDRCG